VKEENFGPVIIIARFSTEDKIIKLANKTRYGLETAYHTKDIERAIQSNQCVKDRRYLAQYVQLCPREYRSWRIQRGWH